MSDDKGIVDQERISRARIPALEAQIEALQADLARTRLSQARAEAELATLRRIVGSILAGLGGVET